MAEFYKQLLKAMKLKCITQTELCKRTQIPKSAMSQYMSGKFKPKQTRTYLIAKALNVSEAWLMGFDDVAMERVTDPDTSHTSQNENINSNKDIFSVHEKKVITAYRNKPEMQPAVDKLLGVEKEVLIPTVKAARSKDNSQPIEIVNLPDLSKIEPDDTDL